VRLPNSAWPRPAILSLIAERVEEAELRRVFNLGVGFVFVIPAAEVDKAKSAIGEPTIDLGEIVTVPAETDFEARVIWP
jgi:phosphoribosylformylglycinamidine cyclo-ligase